MTPPDDHPWAGRTLALFECVACEDQTPNRYLAPGPENISWQAARERGIVVTDDSWPGLPTFCFGTLSGEPTALLIPANQMAANAAKGQDPMDPTSTPVPLDQSG